MRRTRCERLATIPVALLLALQATFATAQTPDAHHPAAGPAACAATPAATPAAADAAPATANVPFDLAFIDLMIPHHQSAIAMAELARQRAGRPEIVQLAEAVVAAQSAEIAQLRAWRQAWYPDAPASASDDLMAVLLGGAAATPGAMPGMEMPGTAATGTPDDHLSMHDTMDPGRMLARLCAPGVGFDLAFVDAMIPHHESAVTMAEAALRRAEHPELRQLAEAIIDAQSREIAEMQAWQSAWAAATPTP